MVLKLASANIGSPSGFENDVKVDGTQTLTLLQLIRWAFENDVKVDGTQTLLL